MTYNPLAKKPALPYPIEIIETRSDGLAPVLALARQGIAARQNAAAALVIGALFVLGVDLGPALAKTSNAVASWYGPGFHGRRTASGERFNQHAMTAAHRTLPFGTRVKVTHKGRSVVVRINDRGPFVRGRSLDLSKGAARQIGCTGVCRVSMTVVGRRGRR